MEKLAFASRARRGEGFMGVGYAPEERAKLNGLAQAIVADCPGVFPLIARGFDADPARDALVYLRTASDAAPVTTSGEAFLGLLASAAAWYGREGIGPDDAVSILAPNCTATSVAYWAAMGAAIVHPLNLLFSQEAVAAQVNAVKAKVLFAPPPGTPGGLYEKAESLRASAPGLKRIVVLPLDGRVAFDNEEIKPDPNWRQHLRAAPAIGAGERIAALLPTGGTTGAPKVVRLSNRNIVASAVASMLAYEITREDRMLLSLPLFHVGGAFCSSLSTFAAGGALVIPTAGGLRNPEVVAGYWRIIESQRITLGALVPTALGAVAGVPTAGADLSRLRFFATGASVCPPEIERRFLAAWPGDSVRQVYGMTEFAGAITSTPHDRTQPAGSVGLPVALVEVAVLADGAIHRGPSPGGEILARGPQVFPGYLDDRQKGASFHEGWLRSGDIGRIGADGEVYVTGRIKDVIIRGGHNIDPTGIEDAALAFPGVALAAAVGLPDAYAGETPMLFVTAAPGATIDRAALAAFVERRILEAPARPREIAIINEMPMTPIGKIFKPRLREIAAEQAARAAIAAASPGVRIDIRATTESERGLVLTATVPDGFAEPVRAALGGLPLPFDIVAA
jgi:fatty-acyl-CoA synthase